ncbi:uncharacterized protein VTP21DRAFT_10827 [Calcarisporiella thermophila]|uniref:uncharacterized protein n=1 Tax=Calcarisporiella thermophila TaxID=911321 RepID=UPI0037434508
MTFTSPPNLYQSVLESSRKCRENSKIEIKRDAIVRFLTELTEESWSQNSVANGMSFPLKFESLEQECNILGLIDILNTGHGFRKELHESCDRGAFETIVFGVMSFHIGSTSTTADSLSRLTSWEVASHFGLEIEQDVPTNLPHVTMSKPTELAKLAKQIQEVLNETGRILQEKGFKTFGAFVIDAAKQANRSAEKFSEALINTFPAFQDATELDGQPLYVFKKALLLASTLQRRFATTEPIFDFKDIHKSPIFADNVIPTMLVHFGMLEIPVNLKHTVIEGASTSVEESYRLRAAAIDVCHEIAMMANSSEIKTQVDFNVKPMLEVDLDVYLWRVAKEPQYRKIPRFHCKETIFF